MIRIEGLTKSYGSAQALRGVSFEVPRGQVVGFLGPNGAGKSTTLRILTSYLPATSGIATVAGFDIMTQSIGQRARRVALIAGGEFEAPYGSP